MNDDTDIDIVRRGAEIRLQVLEADIDGTLKRVANVDAQILKLNARRTQLLIELGGLHEQQRQVELKR
jgi:hypothetical protein